MHTTDFLMANLGSEMSRLFSAQENGKIERSLASAERARIIIAELIEHPALQGRTSEVEMLETILDDSLLATPLLAIRPSDLRSYFAPFALKSLAGV